MIHKFEKFGKKIVVDTNSGAIHVVDDIVYENNQKESQETVVLLSGFGTENPNNDFKCLIDELQKNFRSRIHKRFNKVCK